MRILFTISQLSGGGAERVVALLSGEMAKRGHEVGIVTLLDCPVVYELDSKVKHICLKCTNSRITGTLEQIRALRTTYKEINPDIIISFLPVVNMTAILANRGLKSKLIVSERNDPNQNPRKKAIRKCRDFLYKFADGFVFQTEDARNYFGNYAIERGTVIANPITGSLPEPYKGIRKKKFVTAVRLEPQKNLEMLIDAFGRFVKICPEYVLEIYGEGSQRKYLENKCKEMNVEKKVFFNGFSKHLHQNTLDAAAFIMPSNYEGMSNSLLEALALGVPVISTDHPIGGARMFIKNGENGILTKVGDTCEMFNALQFAANNPEKMQAMADEAIKIRQQISVEKIVSQWMNYVKKVCE